MHAKTPRDIIAECRHAGSLPSDPSPEQIRGWLEDVVHNCGQVAKEAHAAIVSGQCAVTQRQAWEGVERDAQAMLLRARVLGRKARITRKDVSDAGALYDTFVSSMTVLTLKYDQIELARDVPLVL